MDYKSQVTAGFFSESHSITIFQFTLSVPPHCGLYTMLRNTLPTLLGLVSVSSAALYETKIETKYGSVQGYPACNSSNTGKLTH